MVFNLQQTVGIVSLEANSEDSELIVAFNQDTLTVGGLFNKRVTRAHLINGNLS